MAKSFLDGANYNFQQRAGTGAAFVLGENKAVDQYVATKEHEKAQSAAQAAAAQKARQANDLRINQSISKISPGEYSQQFGSAIQEDYNNLIAKAKQMQSMGIDPTTNQEFLKEQSLLQNKAAASKELKTQYNSFFKEYGANPDGFDNGQELFNAYQDPDVLNKFISGEFRPGPLQKRYTEADIIKLTGDKPVTISTNDGKVSKTVPDHQQHVDKATATLQMPEVRTMIKKRGGDSSSPYPEGFYSVSEKGVKSWNTDKATLKEQALDQLEQDPSFMEFLGEKGLDISTPEKAIESAVDYMEKQNKAVSGYVESYANKLTGGANTKFKKEFAAQRMAITQENAERDRVKDGLSIESSKLTIEKKKKDLSKDGSGTGSYGEALLSGVQGGNKEALSDLQRAYSSKGTVKLSKDKKSIIVEPLLGKVGEAQTIPLSDTERVKALLRGSFPENQMKATVNNDVYADSKTSFVNKTGGLMPNDLDDEKAQSRALIEKYSKK